MGRKYVWVQGTLTTLMRVFERLRLYTNLGKAKSMPCTPGFIWGKMGQDAYKRRAMGEGAIFWEWNFTRVSIIKCSAMMAESSLRNNM